MSEHETGEGTPEPTATVLVYSDDAGLRERVRLALGRRPASDLPRIEYVETATEPAVTKQLDSGTVDLAILDGETAPAGGMGVCRAAKNEVYRCPPILVLIGRPQDGWLATWSMADGVVSYPLDPMELARESARLLRERLAPAVTAGTGAHGTAGELTQGPGSAPAPH